MPYKIILCSFDLPVFIVFSLSKYISSHNKKLKIVWSRKSVNSIRRKTVETHAKKLENFGGHLLNEDDHSYWAPPYWNITNETLSFDRTEL